MLRALSSALPSLPLNNASPVLFHECGRRAASLAACSRCARPLQLLSLCLPLPALCSAELARAHLSLSHTLSASLCAPLSPCAAAASNAVVDGIAGAGFKEDGTKKMSCSERGEYFNAALLSPSTTHPSALHEVAGALFREPSPLSCWRSARFNPSLLIPSLSLPCAGSTNKMGPDGKMTIEKKAAGGEFFIARW